MIDDLRLEPRLRADPTGDPHYVPGRFRDRTARAATRRVTARGRAATSRQTGTLLAAAIIAALVIIGRVAPAVGPMPTPSPTPTASPGSVDDGKVREALAAWSSTSGGASVSVVLLDPRGELHVLQIDSDSALPAASTVRIGEVSRVFVASAVVGLDECAGTPPQFACPSAPRAPEFSLDDAVTEWLPAANVNAAITIRDLLTGTSGLPGIGPSVADLSRQVAANPGRDWSRATLLKAALAQPARFSPGARSEPVDTEFMLLEDIIGAVDDRDPGLWIDDVAGHGHGGEHQGPWVRPPTPSLVPGGVPGMTDLDPTVLAIVRDAGGMWASSEGLARSAAEVWGSTIVHAPEGIATLTDADQGHAAPLAAIGLCPCSGDVRSTIVQTGRAVAWSAAMAYDVEARIALGVAAPIDIDDAALRDLVVRLLAAARG
jgi:hypothetical protein